MSTVPVTGTSNRVKAGAKRCRGAVQWAAMFVSPPSLWFQLGRASMHVFLKAKSKHSFRKLHCCIRGVQRMETTRPSSSSFIPSTRWNLSWPQKSIQVTEISKGTSNSHRAWHNVSGFRRLVQLAGVAVWALEHYASSSFGSMVSVFLAKPIRTK